MQVAVLQRHRRARAREVYDAEREWLCSKIQCGLEKTHRLLQELGMRESADVLVIAIDDFAGRGSLDFVSQELEETSGKILRSMFTEAEWAELAAVDAALMRKDVDTLVNLREERLGALFRTARTLLPSSPVRGELLEEMTGLAGVLNDVVSKSAVESEEEEEEEEEEVPPSRRKRNRRAKEEVSETLKKSRRPVKSSSVPEKVVEREPMEEEEEEEQQTPESSSEEEEKEVEEEDEEEEVVTVDALLEQIRNDQDLVLRLMKLSGQSCSVREFGVPNLAAVSSKFGEELVADTSRLASCFQQQQQQQEPHQIEDLGRLLSWWRLVERCIRIMSVVECLKEKQKTTLRIGRGKRGQKVPLSSLFNQLVAQVESQGGKCLRLRQALCYDQLGKFLQQYPRFLFQLQVVTLQDWRVWLRKDRGLESRLDDSWKIIPHQDAHDGRVCGICGNSDKDGDRKLWSCNECESLFHEYCGGYSKHALCGHVMLEEKEFALGAYCPPCLDTLQHSHKDVEQAVAEARTISAFLKDPGCPFVLKRILGDGACLFHLLYEFEGGGGWSMDEFCGEVAKAALNVPEAAGCSVEDREGLQKLVRAKKRVQLLTQRDHWHVVNVQLILFGYVGLFKDIQVKVFQAHKGQVFCGESSGSYGNGPRVLNVLQWNSAFYRHYDRLVAKSLEFFLL